MSSLLDEMEEALFLAMLDSSRKGAGPVFELKAICEEYGINATTNDLLSFLSDNDGLFGSKDRSTMTTLRFEINSNGIRRAKEIEASRKTPRLIKGLVGDTSQKLVNVLNAGIAVLALGIAIAAYFKDAP